jgi:hypothetical protein
VSQAFEWVVHDVQKLRDFVEGRSPEDAADGRDGPDRDDFGVLRESPTLGEGKYKLEIGMKKKQDRFLLLTLDGVVFSADDD